MESIFTAPVDLTNCDREPIHIPGSIQPHGAMLVCGPDGMIVHASANASTLLGCTVDPVGQTLSNLLGAQAAHDLRNEATKSGGSHIAGVLLGRNLPGAEQPLDVSIHSFKGRMFVEFEPSAEGEGTGLSAIDLTQSLIRRISLESDATAIAATGAKLARAMLGYDRVMVY